MSAIIATSHARQVIRAQRAIRQSPDTRALKRELANGNRYAHGWLARRGLRFIGGAITRIL